MRRRRSPIFFNALAALSALLFTATAVLWARGFWIADGIGYVDGSGVLDAHISSYRGAVRAYVFFQADAPYHQRSRFEYGSIKLPTDDSVIGALAMAAVLGAPLNAHAQFGFVVQRFPSKDYQNLTCQAPDWFILIVAGFPPGYAALRWRRRRKRIKEGRCIRCGYDLRSTPMRCPECGEPAATSPATP